MRSITAQTRRISYAEHLARLAVLEHVFPLVLRACSKASGLAESRLRRSFAIERHARGRGIEVGAAATPATVPVGSRVTYVDKYDVNVLRRDPELADLVLRPPDIIASAERLETISDGSQDFVLGFSLLEHVQDAIGSLGSFLRVTRPGGTIVLTIPDKRFYGPDTQRPVTQFDHFVRDHREGPEWSREGHFREVARVCYGMAGSALEDFVRTQIETDAHTHFHVWDADSFLQFIVKARDVLATPYDVVEFASYGNETLVVVQKPE